MPALSLVFRGQHEPLTWARPFQPGGRAVLMLNVEKTVTDVFVYELSWTDCLYRCCLALKVHFADSLGLIFGIMRPEA